MKVQVQTSDGFVERRELTVRDIVTENDAVRVIATEWYRDGRLVRRDVNANPLRWAELSAKAP